MIKSCEEIIYDLIEEKCRNLELNIDNKGSDNIRRYIRNLMTKVKIELSAYECEVSAEFNEKLKQL